MTSKEDFELFTPQIARDPTMREKQFRLYCALLSGYHANIALNDDSTDTIARKCKKRALEALEIWEKE